MFRKNINKYSVAIPPIPSKKNLKELIIVFSFVYINRLNISRESTGFITLGKKAAKFFISKNRRNSSKLLIKKSICFVCC